MPGDPPDGETNPRPAVRRFELPGYEVSNSVGRGAFGVVYRASETAFDRAVAIKVLTVALDDDTQGRFDRECRSVGLVSGHPNIITVYASGQDDMGRPYLVMELMEAGSLAERLEQDGPLGWEDTVEVGVKLAGALETAHRAGILHRDVKPENVLISAYGEPKLGDFGISSIPGTQLTRSGIITATPLYAAPEILNGLRASVASDLYSLGATLFCLVTGAPAFVRDDDETTFALFYRISTDPVPDLRPQGVPDDVCRVVEAAMAKDPAMRPSSAAALGEALRQAQHQHGLAATEMRVIVDRNETVVRQPAAPLAAPLVAPPAPSHSPTPPAGGDPMPPAAPAAPARRPRRRRLPLLVATLAAVMALVVAVVVLDPWDSSGKGADVRASDDPNAPATLDLAKFTHASGIVVDRTWALEGSRGETFSSRVRVTNPTDKPITYFHDEVIPKSLAGSLDPALVVFAPQPSVMVSPDPVVRYAVPLIPGATFEFSYRVVVPGEGRDAARLQKWARDRADEEGKFQKSAAALPLDKQAIPGVDADGTVNVPDPANPGSTVVVGSPRPRAPADSQSPPVDQPQTPKEGPDTTSVPTTATTTPPRREVLMPDLFSAYNWDASAMVDALFDAGVDLGNPGKWSFGGDPRRGIVYQPTYTDGYSFEAFRVWSQYPAPGTPLRDGMVVAIAQWDKSYCDDYPGEHSIVSNWCYEEPPTQRVMTAFYDRHGPGP